MSSLRLSADRGGPGQLHRNRRQPDSHRSILPAHRTRPGDPLATLSLDRGGQWPRAGARRARTTPVLRPDLRPAPGPARRSQRVRRPRPRSGKSVPLTSAGREHRQHSTVHAGPGGPVHPLAVSGQLVSILLPPAPSTYHSAPNALTPCPWAAAGRRAGVSTRRPARSGRKAQPNALNTTEVREWAKAQGIDVKDRGRVPAELVVKFKAATGQ
jgi:hypothetical protein